MENKPTHIDQKLLVLYLLGEISQQGRLKVEAWLNHSEANRIWLESFQKTWEATAKIDAASVAFDTNAGWEKMKMLMSDEVKEVYEVGRGDPRSPEISVKNVQRVKIGIGTGVIRVILAVAAVIVFTVVSVVYIRSLRNSGDDAMTIASVGEVPVQDTLTDGSKVILNSNSKLIVPVKFAKANRVVKLRGEAFFQVQPDASIVNADVTNLPGFFIIVPNPTK